MKATARVFEQGVTGSMKKVDKGFKRCWAWALRRWLPLRPPRFGAVAAAASLAKAIPCSWVRIGACREHRPALNGNAA